MSKMIKTLSLFCFALVGVTVGAATTMTASVAAANNANTQKFYINQNVGESSFRIHSREYRDGAYSIEIDNASTAAGAKVKKFGWQGGAYKTQFWVFENISDLSAYGGAIGYRSVANSVTVRCFSYALERSQATSLVMQYGDSVTTVFARVKTVVEGLDRSFRPVTRTENIRRDEYRIAMRVGSHVVNGQKECDYHFMVQLSNGQWAHKQGATDSKNLGAINPDTYSWDLAGVTNFYNSSTKYFAVSR